MHFIRLMRMVFCYQAESVTKHHSHQPDKNAYQVRVPSDNGFISTVHKFLSGKKSCFPLILRIMYIFQLMVFLYGKWLLIIVFILQQCFHMDFEWFEMYI
jgi:hypothetical protein